MTYAHQRKRAKANRRAKAAKAIQQQTEGIYVHPSPFDTNVYWHEEMTLGPGPPQRKGNRDRNKTDSTRRLNTGGQASSAGGSSADTTLVVRSFDSVREEEEMEEREGEGWNRRRYQRADEMLWGQEDPTVSSYLSFGSLAASKPTVNSEGTFYGSRNPAVNDLHPPVVSTKPTHPSQTRWMLQPPPPAKVMAGKERASRSRSTSAASYGSTSRGIGGAMAGGQISVKRSIEGKQAGQKPENHELAAAQMKSAPLASSNGQRHDRYSRFPVDSDDLASPTSKRRRPPPIRVIDDARKRMTRTASSPARPRPKLEAIQSSELVSPRTADSGIIRDTSRLFTHLSPASGVIPSASSSLQALQELLPGTSYIRAPSPSHEASIRLPTATEAEEQFLTLPSIPSEFPGGDSFHFPSTETSTLSGVQSQPAQRWSMDI